MDIDRALLSVAVRKGEVSSLVNYGVQTSLFEGDAKKLWIVLFNHWKKYNSALSEQEFSERFPDYGLADTPEPALYYIDRARARYKHNALAETVRSVTKFLKDGEADKALDSIRSSLLSIDDVSSESVDYDWVGRAKERTAQYEALKNLDGVDGIPTPFDGLNRKLGGFHNGELIFIAARAGVGKTWCEVILALTNWTSGVTPLLFTKEMSDVQIARRLDAKLSSLPYGKFRSGLLTSEEEKGWRADMDNLSKQENPFWIVGGDRGGVASISAKAEKYRPDVIYIDGMYLLDDDRRGEAEWLRLQNVAMDLKRLAQRMNIPIVASLQFNNDDRIAGADLSRWGDVILALEQTEDQRMRSEMTLRIEKHREGSRDSFELTWDIESMNFGEIQPAVYAAAPRSIQF